MSMIECHRKLLGDPVRNAAFVKALRRVIIPGKTTVADIGSGTGYLSFLAAKLGAKSCTLYEVGDVVHLSKEIAKQNGIRNCRFVHKHSTQVRDPERADVVISETLGNFALEEHILETMNDAKRFLKPGGTLIPQRLTQYVVPVISDRLHREINVWDSIDDAINFSAAKSVGLQNMYVKTVRPDELLSGKEALKIWDRVDFRKKESSIRTGSATWTLEKPVTCFGFALFWECEVLPGITLSTSPEAPATHWEQIYLPLLAPLVAQKGSSLDIALHADARLGRGTHLRWDVTLRSPQQKEVKIVMDTRKGFIA